MGVAPFPWAGLARVSTREPSAIAVARRRFASLDAASVALRLGELTGHGVGVDARRRAVVEIGQVDLGARGAVVVLEGDGCVVAVEVESELALAVIGVLAGGRTLARVARGRAIGPELAGALAGVVQHLARACGAEGLAIVAVGASTGEVRARLGLDAVLVCDVTVRLGALRSRARVAVATGAFGVELGVRASARATLVALGDTPLRVGVVVGAGRASSTLGAFRAGDVLVVDGLSRERCVLAPARSSVGVEAARIEGGRVRLGARRVDLAAAAAPDEDAVEGELRPRLGRDPNQEGAVSEPSDGVGETVEMPAVGDDGPLAEALAEAPLHVRIEAGSVTMPARAWAAMGPGDVVVLDRRIGEPFTVRIGGREVARGELVDVDGALGVRILERVP